MRGRSPALFILPIALLSLNGCAFFEANYGPDESVTDQDSSFCGESMDGSCGSSGDTLVDGKQSNESKRHAVDWVAPLVTATIDVLCR
jgi:hypothetical protein